MLNLRERQLRAPIGLTLTNSDLENERRQHHFGLFNSSGDLCACVVLSMENSGQQGKLRQMAVAKKYQLCGMGRLLFEHVESWCRVHGVSQIVLNARTSVKGFYHKLGFTEYGVEFVQATLPHIKMLKTL
ncbi:MAG: GNAT family N-acetyltransferase [Proteobacteria bacterium]|nr:GNAT family N-acetyltransferase [Pseudomonadota bacterium]